MSKCHIVGKHMSRPNYEICMEIYFVGLMVFVDVSGKLIESTEAIHYDFFFF